MSGGSKEVSMETKVELSSSPELTKPMMAQLLLEIIKNSEIENEEKLKILDGIKIHITELAYVRQQKSRTFAAFLKTMNSPNNKAHKEINALLVQLTKEELDIQLKFLKYVEVNLKGKGDPDTTEDIINALTNQMQGVQTNQEMNQI
jgi:hypothetical protein